MSIAKSHSEESGLAQDLGDLSLRKERDAKTGVGVVGSE